MPGSRKSPVARHLSQYAPRHPGPFSTSAPRSLLVVPAIPGWGAHKDCLPRTKRSQLPVLSHPEIPAWLNSCCRDGQPLIDLHGRQARNNDSRAPCENNTYRPGSSGTERKKCNEPVRITTMCDFRTQAESDPLDKCRGDRYGRQVHATLRNRTSVSM